MGVMQTELNGWGRYPRQQCTLSRPERYAGLMPSESVIARGQGRAYGDAALNENGHVLLTERVNRFLEFDETSGRLRAEAGVTFDEILNTFVPWGWFPKITPGTRYVSLGGALAADVHGKNHHHEGTFSAAVNSIKLITADGEQCDCSPAESSDLYWATVGGMGLTGIIGEVEMALHPIESAYIEATHHRARNLDEAFSLFENEVRDEPYSVAWIDCLSKGANLGRSVVMAGRHAELDDLESGLRNSPLELANRGVKNFPVDLPGWVLNPLTVSAFNSLYYRVEGRKQQPFITDYQKFFYPLDAIGKWNRLYGRNGFLQYQCVLPLESSHAGIQQLLERLSRAGIASFLAVLKRMGREGKGMLSFPMEGYTLALDIPIKGEKVFELLGELDTIVVEHGGRVYLAKDARLDAEHFKAMYPRFDEWLEVKKSIDPENCFSSSLSRRLGLEANQ